jgi:hypothetical protein
MIFLRKEHAGSCNLGYSWPEDGSVVEVTPEHAALLLAVPDGDFTAVAAPETTEVPADEPVDTSIEEPAPEAPISEAPPARKAPAKRAAAKKTAEAAPETSVEE